MVNPMKALTFLHGNSAWLTF